MAANDEFPRGGVASVTTNGTIASITLPATPGIAHVVTSIDAALVQTVAGSGATFFEATMTDSVTGDVLYTPWPQSSQAALSGGSSSWTGQFIGSVGGAIVIAFNGTASSFFEILTVEWYDI
jgi:hypothetical protein